MRTGPSRCVGRRPGRSCARALVGLGLAGLLAGPAAASTFVLIEPEAHARAADAVVVGWVTSVGTTASAGGGVETHVEVWVEEALKGVFPTGFATFRQPGGRLGGLVQEIHGAPAYAPGERVLLLLRRDGAGRLRPSHLALGKFRIVRDAASGRDRAERDFGDARVLTQRRGRLVPAEPGQARGPFALDTLLPRLRAATAGAPGEVYFPDLAPSGTGGGGQQLSGFTLLPNPARWFEADSGIPVGMAIDVAGDGDLGQPASTDAVVAGMDAWSDLPGASIELEHAGDVFTPTPINGCDGLSHVMFEDPFDEIAAPVGCGGTLALGGGCYTTGETIEINGTVFNRRTEGDVTFADGFGAGCAFKTPCNFGEVAAHEMGHVIGLDHSSDTNATLYEFAQFDGRCASLMPDDVAGAEFVYPLLLAGCGDGVIDAGEACDDGGTLQGDGCSSVCELEAGFACVGEPSLCTAICTDGLVRGNEACDDGNPFDGDGCSAACTLEPGYSCTGEPSSCTAACSPAPAGTCTPLGPGGRALLFLKDDDADGPSTKDRVVFQWVRGPALTQAALGNPLDGGGQNLCFYEDDGGGHQLRMWLSAPDGLQTPGRWSEIPGKGYKYVDANRADDGILKLIAKGGDAGRSKWILVGKGSQLPIGGVLPASPSAVEWLVETRGGDPGAACLEARFDPATDVVAEKYRPGTVDLLRLRFRR